MLKLFTTKLSKVVSRLLISPQFKFYLDTVKPFAGEGIALEGNIGKWWVKQEYKVGHNEGLFMHNDWAKYGR